MGSKLTPRKIDRLMKLANGSTTSRQLLNSDYLTLGNLNEKQVESITAGQPFMINKYKSSGELSSGILDLEQCEGFGESCGASMSTAFNPGEITGRSTEAESIGALTISDNKTMHQPSIDDVINMVNKQTCDVHEIMRHSIASGFAPRDLTADEESFVVKESPLPVMPNKINMNLTKNMDQKDDSQISVGTYFINRCSEFSNMFPQADSPRGHNLLEGDNIAKPENPVKEYEMNISLDNVPVRQPRPTTTVSAPKVTPVDTQSISNTRANKSFSKNPLFVDPTKQHLQTVNEESSQDDASFSISAIETYLWNQKEVRPSNAMKQLKREIKKPLKETNNIVYNQHSDDFVVQIKDKRTDSGSSTASTNTVICVDKKSNLENIPEIIINKAEGKPSLKLERSDFTKRSPSNSPRRLQENLVSTSYRSANSPKRSTKSRASLIEEWAEINVEPIIGYVGVPTKVIININSLTKSWLTAWMEFNMVNERELSIKLPTFPMTFAPKVSNKITVTLQAHQAVATTLKFILKLKDIYGCMEQEQIGNIEANFKLPSLQIITNEGKDCNIKFPPTQENTVLKKIFVLTSDCSGDLMVDLALLEGSGLFTVSHVQEIKKGDVKLDAPEICTDARVDRQSNTKTCKIPTDGALRVLLTFTAPKLTELQLKAKKGIFNGLLSVYLNDSGILLRNIELFASVGIVELVVELPTNKLHVIGGKKTFELMNMGSIPGKWALKFKGEPNLQQMNYFQIDSNVLKLNPGVTASLNVRYIGPEDKFNESNLLFEDMTTRKVTMLQITAGQKIIKGFPIKTTLNEMSWVREGRKDISLKNYCDKKITIRCKIIGNGFYMETVRANCTDLLLTLASHESRNICVVFKPTSAMPHKGKLMIFMDNEHESWKNIRLHACGGGGGGVSWRGLLCVGQTALLNAAPTLHAPIRNNTQTHAFVSVHARFNLQYASLQSSATLRGDRAVIPGQTTARITLVLEWPRVEKIARDTGGVAGTIVTLSVLTGAESTRQRILRILREEANGEIDISKLSEHLQRLVGTFEGEDSGIKESLQDYEETKKSLDVLMGGIKEITAQVDLSEDFGDQTICLTEDTVLEHHTLCD